MEQEEAEEEEEKETKPDPLHQLILHFSRTALTEKRSGRSNQTQLIIWRALNHDCCLFFQLQQTRYRSPVYGICRHYGKGAFSREIPAARFDICHLVYCSLEMTFHSVFILELPYWWRRRNGRGNDGTIWRWDVLWGATVRTGNGRPGARDQEHGGAVAFDASSELIIGAFTSQPHLFLSVPSCYLYVLFVGSASFITSFLTHQSQSSNPDVLFFFFFFFFTSISVSKTKRYIWFYCKAAS